MSKNCLSCDLAAAGAILIKTYCKDKCDLLVKEFQQGNMTIRTLAERVGADGPFLKHLSKEVPVDLTLNEALKQDNFE